MKGHTSPQTKQMKITIYPSMKQYIPPIATGDLLHKFGVALDNQKDVFISKTVRIAIILSDEILVP